MRLGIFHKALWLVLAAALSASGAWLYAELIVKYQIAQAAAEDRPRGNLSDVYPRWLGAKELLLHGRDPYSPAVTREIQQGFYGRALDPARPGDPKDQEAFVYPLYVVFYLAPTIHLPFEIVRRAFFWILIGLTIATVSLWLRMLKWQLPLWARACIVMLTIGSLPVMQGLKLQQLTLLVVALLAAAMALLVSHRPIAAGVALALATIKPQHVWLLLLWLMIWTLADWRRRYRWAASFLLTMAVLLAASEWYVPYWIPRFLQAVREYQRYTDAVSLLEKCVPAPWGWLLRVLAATATVHVCWKNRRFAEETPTFAANVSLVLAVTVVITVSPTFALYNQAMLLPGILMLVRQRHHIWQRNRISRALLSLAAVLLLWPWLASIVLAGLTFVLPIELVEPAWAVPFWTVLPLPLVVTAMILGRSYQEPFAAPTGPTPS